MGLTVTPSGGPAFATPTIGVSSSYGAGTAATVIRSDATLKIPMALGGVIPITGGRLKRISNGSASLAQGNNDLYTVPSNTRCMISPSGGGRVYNNSVGAITAFIYVQFGGSGTRYQIATAVVAVTSHTAAVISIPLIVLEPGDVIGVNVATTDGLNIVFPAVEFPSSVPVYSSVVKNPASGDNTVYTCPASTNAMVFANTASSSASGIIITVNASGGSLNVYSNVVPSGSSVGATNQFSAATALAGSPTTQSTTSVPTTLNAGDVLSVNWSGINTGGLSWVTVAEIAGV